MLKLSKKWSYAMKAVIYIAKSNDLVKVLDIANDEQISESLLRRIIADLERNNIVKTVKWRNWWVSLWNKINKISVYDILKAVREELWISDCTKWISCYNHDNCSTTDFYSILQTWFHSLLKMYTLDKII
jgi:Rrf2 family transcriptional regulator, iron-sulfur cluster assembly transcription factor